MHAGQLFDFPCRQFNQEKVYFLFAVYHLAVLYIFPKKLAIQLESGKKAGSMRLFSVADNCCLVDSFSL